MVRHQDVGVNQALVMVASIDEPIMENEVVVVVAEDLAAIVAALNDMQRLVRCKEPGLSRHSMLTRT